MSTKVYFSTKHGKKTNFIYKSRTFFLSTKKYFSKLCFISEHRKNHILNQLFELLPGPIGCLYSRLFPQVQLFPKTFPDDAGRMLDKLSIGEVIYVLPFYPLPAEQFPGSTEANAAKWVEMRYLYLFHLFAQQ